MTKILPDKKLLEKKLEKLLSKAPESELKRVFGLLLKVQAIVHSIAQMLEEADFTQMESALFWGSMDGLKWQELKSHFCNSDAVALKLPPETANEFLKELIKDAKRTTKEDNRA